MQLRPIDWFAALPGLNLGPRDAPMDDLTWAPTLPQGGPRFAKHPYGRRIAEYEIELPGERAIDHWGRPIDPTKPAFEHAFADPPEAPPLATPEVTSSPAPRRDHLNVRHRIFDKETNDALDKLQARYGDDIPFASPLTASREHYRAARGMLKTYREILNVRKEEDIQEQIGVLARELEAWVQDYENRADRLMDVAPGMEKPLSPKLKSILKDAYKGADGDNPLKQLELEYYRYLRDQNLG